MVSPNSKSWTTKAQRDECERTIRDALRRTLQARRPLTGSEWANANFYLSPESSGQEGRFEAIPYQVAILDVMGADEPRVVDFQKCSRIGYTKCLDALVAYNLEHKRRNVVVYQPTDGDAQDFCKSEIDPMVRDVPVLAQLADAAENKKRSDTLTMKKLGRKILYILGGNAPARFRRVTADTVLYDELDGFDPEIGDEGDPLSLGDRCITNASFPKSIRGSTPGTALGSLIAQCVNRASLVFEYWVRCLECETAQPLRWAQMRFQPDGSIEERAASAQHACHACGVLWNYRDIWRLLEGGAWTAARELKDGSLEATHIIKTGQGDPVLLGADGMPEDWPRHVAFRMWAAYSPFMSWAELIQEWLEAQGHPGKLRTFTNHRLGEPFEEAGEKIDEHELFERRENYLVPADVLIVLAAIDVQVGRVEIEVAGFGLGETCWHLEHRVVYGETEKADSPVWRDLNDILVSTTFARDDGRLLKIDAATLDTGYATETCYRVLKKVVKHPRVFAIKGMGGEGRAIISPPSTQRTPEGKEVQLFTVGVDAAKALVMARLSPKSLSPIRLNLSVTMEQCEQLTAEVRRTKYQHGFARKRWVKIRDRNEMLDLMAYLLACLYILNPSWPGLAKRALPPVPKTEQKPAAPKPPPRFPKGWATNWGQ